MRPLHVSLVLLLALGLAPAQSGRAQELFETPLSATGSGAQLLNLEGLRIVTAPGLMERAALAGLLNKFRVLDARPRADYDAGHVPQSVWVDAKKAQEIAARPGGLSDQEAWIEWTKPLGLMPDMVVVVLDGDRQLDAARVWWLLRYLGVDKAGLVDGNFALWQTQRRPVTTVVPNVAPNPYPVEFRRDRLATRDDVLASLKAKDARIVDARSIKEYTGQALRSKRGGHMPDACRLEWLDFVDKYGRFASRAKVEAKFAAAGIKPGEQVIAHCQGGGRASVDAFVFEALGYPTRNYYASWADWGNADDTPITTADEPRTAPIEAVGPKVPAPQYTAPALVLAPQYTAPASVLPAVEPVLSSPTATPTSTAPDQPGAGKPFTVEYDYKAKWGAADEFLTLFRKNHLPILRERMKQGDILSITMTKPRIHTGEADRWDFRVTLVFKDAAEAFNIAADEPIKRHLFPDQTTYKAEEQRRFTILESHTDLPIEPVDLD